MQNHTPPQIILLAIASAGLLLGCGGEDNSEAPPAAQNSPATSGSAPLRLPPIPPSEPASPGQELAAKIEIPDFYPSDGPIYPNTKPSKVIVQASKVNLMFGTPDSISAANSTVMSELDRLGWANADSHELENGVAIQATKPGRQLMVLISRVDEGRDTETTLIAVSVDR